MKRLEQSMESHQPQQGPPRALITLTLEEMSFFVGKEGGGRLLVFNEEGGGSHQGQSINLRPGVDGRKMDSLPAAHECEIYS